MLASFQIQRTGVLSSTLNFPWLFPALFSIFLLLNQNRRWRIKTLSYMNCLHLSICTNLYYAMFNRKSLECGRDLIYKFLITAPSPSKISILLLPIRMNLLLLVFRLAGASLNTIISSVLGVCYSYN